MIYFTYIKCFYVHISPSVLLHNIYNFSHDLYFKHPQFPLVLLFQRSCYLYYTSKVTAQTTDTETLLSSCSCHLQSTSSAVFITIPAACSIRLTVFLTTDVHKD